MKTFLIGFQMKKNSKNYKNTHLILAMQFKELFLSKKIQKEYTNNTVPWKLIWKLLVVILMKVTKTSQISKTWTLPSQMLIQKKKHKRNSPSPTQCLNKIALIHQQSIREITSTTQKKTSKICWRALRKILMMMILMKALRSNLVLTTNRI